MDNNDDSEIIEIERSFSIDELKEWKNADVINDLLLDDLNDLIFELAQKNHHSRNVYVLLKKNSVTGFADSYTIRVVAYANNYSEIKDITVLKRRYIIAFQFWMNNNKPELIWQDLLDSMIKKIYKKYRLI